MCIAAREVDVAFKAGLVEGLFGYLKSKKSIRKIDMCIAAREVKVAFKAGLVEGLFGHLKSKKYIRKIDFCWVFCV